MLALWSSRAGGIDLAAMVLAGPVFSQGKNNISFLQKTSNKQKCQCDFGKAIILSYNR